MAAVCAANALGLTRQVPIRDVYLTSGKTRELTLGQSVVLVNVAETFFQLSKQDQREALEYARAQ